MKRRLTVTNHDRDVAGFRYVYPVVSRRAGGVSVGVNLNPNDACNWRCAYCQVPGLTRGAAPPIDRDLLVDELSSLLGQVQSPQWLETNAPEGFRQIVDVAISGNGEPTTCVNLDEIVEDVLATVATHGPDTPLSRVIISNGSLADKDPVKRAFLRWGEAGGEVWFKVDAGDEASRLRLNGTRQSNERTVRLLVETSARCRTRIQTCVVSWDGAPPGDAERDAYVALLKEAQGAGASIHDILLYGIARESHQPEAQRLDHPGEAWMQSHAEALRSALGLPVLVRL